MHLLRWRAIQLAIREGAAEMDLGGVDVGPDHAEPGTGDPMAGLYEHKRSFGATWVAMTGAHERVIHPWRYRAGRVTTRLARAVGRR
jgi:lipid II:glycine glycyltransferase (peptidoglycan interpeptide bridge formation enzyme)